MNQSHNRDNSIITMSTVTRTSSIFSHSKEVDEDDVFSLYAYDQEEQSPKQTTAAATTTEEIESKQHKRSISIANEQSKVKAILITVFADHEFKLSSTKLDLYAGPVNKQSSIWRKAYYNDYRGFELEKTYTNNDQESIQTTIEETKSIVPSTIDNESIQESHVKVDELEPLTRDPKQKYHLRLTTKDETFATILKKDESTTVQQVLEILDHKYQLRNVKLSLYDTKTKFEIVNLSNDDLIVKKQNDFLIQSGVKIDDLARECLNKQNRYRFIIKNGGGNSITNSRRNSHASLLRDSKINYHLRLSSKDESFKTILKKDETTTLGQVLQTLKHKYHLNNIKIVLEDTKTKSEITGLSNDDLIIRMQNDLLLDSGVRMEDLSTACLNKNNRFRFFIKQDTKNSNVEDTILNRDPKIVYPFRISTPDESFSAVCYKDETTTLSQILSYLAHAYYLIGVNEISLEDTQTNSIIKKFNNKDDQIIKIQNDFLLDNGVKFENLGDVCADENNRFKFIINRL